MSEKEVQAKIRELKSLQAIIEEAESEAEALKDEIKAFMGSNEEMRIGDYKVRYKAVTSSKFDSSAFKATHGELYNQYIKQSTTRRFTVA